MIEADAVKASISSGVTHVRRAIDEVTRALVRRRIILCATAVSACGLLWWWLGRGTGVRTGDGAFVAPAGGQSFVGWACLGAFVLAILPRVFARFGRTSRAIVIASASIASAIAVLVLVAAMSEAPDRLAGLVRTEGWIFDRELGAFLRGHAPVPSSAIVSLSFGFALACGIAGVGTWRLVGGIGDGREIVTAHAVPFAAAALAAPSAAAVHVGTQLGLGSQAPHVTISGIGFILALAVIVWATTGVLFLAPKDPSRTQSPAAETEPDPDSDLSSLRTYSLLSLSLLLIGGSILYQNRLLVSRANDTRAALTSYFFDSCTRAPAGFSEHALVADDPTNTEREPPFCGTPAACRDGRRIYTAVPVDQVAGSGYRVRLGLLACHPPWQGRRGAPADEVGPCAEAPWTRLSCQPGDRFLAHLEVQREGLVHIGWARTERIAGPPRPSVWRLLSSRLGLERDELTERSEATLRHLWQLQHRAHETAVKLPVVDIEVPARGALYAILLIAALFCILMRFHAGRLHRAGPGKESWIVTGRTRGLETLIATLWLASIGFVPAALAAFTLTNTVAWFHASGARTTAQEDVLFVGAWLVLSLVSMTSAVVVMHRLASYRERISERRGD